MVFFVDIALELQTLICTFLHPSDILTLRKTCQTLQLVTRQRIIWTDALRRVCLENTLFLPSFPIRDMSNVELEQAAIAPRRWNELSTLFAARNHNSDSEVRLSPTATRIIYKPLESNQTTRLILIPGGRYMVHFSSGSVGGGLEVWDLGYTSSADCKLIASIELEDAPSPGDVHATPDGIGLVICVHSLLKGRSFYEIYPQSAAPKLTEIASSGLFNYAHRHLLGYVSPDKMIWFCFGTERGRETIFRVWDYRRNASVSFIALIDAAKLRRGAEVVATQTAIIILYGEEISIWAIPPLLPESPNFDDYSPTKLPPAIKVKFPDGLALDPWIPPPAKWKTMSSWYFDPSKPLYFDRVYSRHSQLQRFKIIIKPDFSDATLHFINNICLDPNRFEQEAPLQPMFCEDTLVYTWSAFARYGIYTGSTLVSSDPSITNTPLLDMPRKPSFCPASGRLVHLDTGRNTDNIVVCDFLPHQIRPLPYNLVAYVCRRFRVSYLGSLCIDLALQLLFFFYFLASLVFPPGSL